MAQQKSASGVSSRGVVSFRLDPDLLAWLAARADQAGVSRNDLMASWLSVLRDGVEWVEDQDVKGGPSARERLADLGRILAAGCCSCRAVGDLLERANLELEAELAQLRSGRRGRKRAR